MNHLGIRPVAAHLLLKQLSFLQKLYREVVALGTLMERILTGNETLVHEFGMQARYQTLEWRTKNESPKMKTVVFHDIRGVVHY